MLSLNLSRKYRLKSKKAISSVFERGAKLKKYPIFLLYEEDVERSDPIVKIAISVPKRKLKRAVDRNRMKRLIREALKNSNLNLIDGINNKEKAFNIMFIYQDDKLNSLLLIEEKINILLTRLIERINEDHPIENLCK